MDKPLIPSPYSCVSKKGGRDYQEDQPLFRPLPKASAEEVQAFLDASTQELVRVTCDNREGSTATIVATLSNGTGFVRWLGDSPAALIIYDPDNFQTHCVPLISPHKPQMKKHADGTPDYELTTVKGISWTDGEHYRMVSGNPGWGEGIQRVAVTHSLGDAEFGAAVSKEYGQNNFDVSPHVKAGKKVLLLTASDGILYSETALEEHAQRIGGMIRQGSQTLEELAQAICKSSIQTKDNVTVTLSLMDVPMMPTISAVFDGHGGDKTAQLAAYVLDYHIGLAHQQGIARATEMIFKNTNTAGQYFVDLERASREAKNRQGPAHPQ